MIPNRSFITGLLLFLTVQIYSQHGTLIYAGIASDGIILTTDSRMVFVDQQGERIAAIDSSNKIHLIKGFPAGMAGYNSWGKQNIYTIVNDFNNRELQSNQFDSVMMEFHLYFFEKISDEPAEAKKDFVFLAIGYQNDSPLVIRFTPISFDVYNKGIACSKEAINRSYRSISQTFSSDIKISSSQLEKNVERDMAAYIKKSKIAQSNYGLPLTTVRLYQDSKIPSIENDFRNRSDEINFSILKRKVLTEQRKVIYLVANGKKRFEELLDYLISGQ